MSETDYRAVIATIDVLSGSDDHAKHIVYWAFNQSGVMFIDDAAAMVEELVTAISCGEDITTELRESADYLLKYGMQSLPSANVINAEIKKGGGIHAEA